MSTLAGLADAALVEVRQGLGALAEHRDHHLVRQGSAPDPVVEALARDELHLEVRRIPVGPHVPDPHDVGVFELPEDVGFSDEALLGLRELAERRVEDLHGREDAGGAVVVASVDRAHPARAERRLHHPDVDPVSGLVHGALLHLAE
jgi:hypothetical protein